MRFSNILLNNLRETRALLQLLLNAPNVKEPNALHVHFNLERPDPRLSCPCLDGGQGAVFAALSR